MSTAIYDISSSSDECNITGEYVPNVKSSDSENSIPDLYKRIQMLKNKPTTNNKPTHKSNAANALINIELSSDEDVEMLVTKNSASKAKTFQVDTNLRDCIESNRNMLKSQVPSASQYANVKQIKTTLSGIDKEKEKVARMVDKELKRLQKVAEKNKRQAILKSARNSKPGEAHKHLTAVIDPSVLKLPGGAAILETLVSHEVPFDVNQQILPCLITFFRESTSVDDQNPLKVITQTEQVIAEEMLVVLDLQSFLDLISAQKESLFSYVARVKNLLQKDSIFLLVAGIKNYYSKQKNKKPSSKHLQSSRDNSVNKATIDKICLELQLLHNTGVKLIDNTEDLAKTVFQYTRAIAEKPFKLDNENTGLDFHVDKKRCVKIEKDGQGCSEAWRQQLHQVKNCAMDAATAIVGEYPTPMSLYKAYNECPSIAHGQQMLADIQIRRNAGVLSTSRRIGIELSRRVHQVMTSECGEELVT